MNFVKVISGGIPIRIPSDALLRGSTSVVAEVGVGMFQVF